MSNKIPEKEGGLHRSVHVCVLGEEGLSPHQDERYKAEDIHQLPLVQQCLFLKYQNTSAVASVWLLLECSYHSVVSTALSVIHPSATPSPSRKPQKHAL